MSMRWLVVNCLLLSIATFAEPIRLDKAWAIHPQVTRTDWETLIRDGNLVAGSLVQAEPAPNDWNTGGDLKQLTDGVLAGAEGRMWSDKRAVGWAYQDYARLTFDLGRPQPLGQVVIRLQVIMKDHTLPKTITVALSNDGDTYSPVRNLSARSHPEDDPARTYEALPVDPPGIYAVVLNVGYEARYVRLDFALHGTMVTDELAITPASGQIKQVPAVREGPREYLDYVFDRRDQYRKMIARGNLVLGIPLRYVPTPTQYLNIDEGDPEQLTDGKLGSRTDERIWFERGCVGWQGPPLVTIFADLGRAQPIDSVVIRLLGGAEQNSLEFPDEVNVLLSDDGEDYYQVSSRHKRGLDDLSTGAYDLPEVKLAWVHNFRVPVGQKARYVAVQVVHQKQFVVSDEMAVVRGKAVLPDFRPEPSKRVTIVTSGVAFTPVWGKLPACWNMPLRARLLIQDGRSGGSYGKPSKIVLDVPDTLRFASAGHTPSDVEHQGRTFKRYLVDWRGLGTDFYLQSLLPEGETDVLFTYGDSGNGPENERLITWESLFIPPARVPKRLHVSLSWAEAPSLYKTWPDYLAAQRHLGFNAVGMQPCYWREANVPGYQTILEEARREGFQIIQIESPAGAIARDRKQQETKSVLPDDTPGHVCPAYRGQYYQQEHASFAQHAAWIKPDIIFYDIEAYWNGAQEAPRCSRCLEHFKAANCRDWDEFWAAMGREIHVDMKAAIDGALEATGITRRITYGSYRTEPTRPLNDGLFAFGNLYPNLLQMAMPSLYVAGNQMAVAEAVSLCRSRMPANDIIPWLSTGCYGEYDPVHTRDMILEAFANGSRGVTYYWYGHFDAAHFKYHAEAIDIVAPVEDLFMDGTPLLQLTCSHGKAKVCGMGVGDEKAILVSNYTGLPVGTKITVQTTAQGGVPVWDLHSGKRIGKTDRGGAFQVPLGNYAAHMYYLGKAYAASVVGK